MLLPAVKRLRTSQDILTATEVQKSSISDVVKYVEEVVAIAEQTASGTQQVAGTAKQLSGFHAGT